MHIKSMSTDETELIARIISGSTEDYRALVDRYKQPLYRHCFYIMREEEDAEDMAQEAFVRAYAQLKKYDADKAAFKTWLFAIATHLCLGQLRKRRALPLELEDEDFLVSSLPTPSEDARNQEIHEAVLRLKPQYRTVIALHYWHGYSYEKIAMYMDAPIGSVRGWLHRAKKELKEALS